jgi:hypothetical protein
MQITKLLIFTFTLIVASVSATPTAQEVGTSAKRLVPIQLDDDSCAGTWCRDYCSGSAYYLCSDGYVFCSTVQRQSETHSNADFAIA